MREIIIITGAGVSAESGLSTFRDHNGLWDNYPIEEVATIDAWIKNPKKVNEFYNLRRENCNKVYPNKAHKLIALLEKKYSVKVITQNIDDLHEKAGSTNVLHLHGNINLARSIGTNKTFPVINGEGLSYGSKCPDGYLLRPDVVWFGEEVPNMSIACEMAKEAEIVLIIGTSLQVYPAASIKDYCENAKERYLIDPDNKLNILGYKSLNMPASEGMELIYNKLMSNN